ncbi:hypothetical protein EFP18_08605 [Burkholderia glumae]|uniref:hypothetical protein n=1 Tax=Burkholderia glumae TaxID=337 RepID=UPI000F5EE61C|nr:hypothetical protein [Burkholderia glumae]MCQ0031180.1 hypothetical protein [Burkholderia glumae]MCQ0039519.1 hypothetical protein [Burkholderia glumae]MCR1767156.1 hypothetical protein [Burkholderia glumae]QHP94232.1 hypothetical protein EXE55_25860 [Burkholderia glumae]QJW80551.1 hypothetical protein GAS18_17455 [Burkholderia glumae]
MNEAMILERLRQFEDNLSQGERALHENQQKQDELKRRLLRIQGALEVLRGLKEGEADLTAVAERIRVFEQDLPRDEEQLRKLATSRQEIVNTMTRIEGAIAVLKELLDERRRQSAAGPRDDPA